MRAVHSAQHVFGEMGAYRQDPEKSQRFANPHMAGGEVSHPVAIRHPESGRLALYVNPAFTLGFEGWIADESRPLLEYLYRHAVRPEFTCRFRWGAGLDRLLGQPQHLAVRRQRLSRP